MIITKTYEAPSIDEVEILRYAGYKFKNEEEVDAETRSLLATCLKELEGKLEYKVCYRELPAALDGDVCDFGFFQIASKHLAHHLSGASRVVVFAATLGVGIDRLITKYSSLSPAKALMFQAIGAERIEALCDTFCEDVRKMYAVNGVDKQAGANQKLPRFSPGYGDLSLGTQRDVFAVLECEKKIGLTLNSSLLMSPSKSVTAFVGINK